MSPRSGSGSLNDSQKYIPVRRAGTSAEGLTPWRPLVELGGYQCAPQAHQPESLAAMPEMISAMYGVDFGLDDIGPYGESLLALERDFNRAAGFTAEDDRLPKFFSEERLPPHNVIWDVVDEDLNQVCGWSPVLEV